MNLATLAALVDDVAAEPVLVIGSLPPDGRDLDLLASPAAERRIATALEAAGAVQRGRAHAVLGAGSGVVVEIVPSTAWGVPADEVADAVGRAIPVEGCRHLMRPAPEHVLLLVARRLSHAGGLDERRRERVAAALREDPSAWVAARARASQWHLQEALSVLQTAYASGAPVPRSVVVRLVAERERGRGAAAPVAMLRARRPARATRRGAVVAISGLDGSGKSSQAQLLVDALRAVGVDAVVEWRRLAQGSGLDAVARPAKSLLRRLRGRRPERTVAVHYSRSERDSASQLRQRSRLLTWLWSVVVTATHIRSQRAAVVPHVRAGRVVVCDRYTLDSVVTLRFRYGAGRLLTQAVRLLTPRATRAYFLDIAPAESLRRKDDGYELGQLETMHALYAAAWPELGVTRLDGTRPVDDLAREIARDLYPTLP